MKERLFWGENNFNFLLKLSILLARIEQIDNKSYL